MITRILILTLAATVASLTAEEKPQGGQPRPERKRPEGGEHGPNFERAGLTKEEADKLKAALDAAKSAPAVQAAQEAAKKAMGEVKAAKEAGKTREEIEPLMKAAREAHRAVMEATAAAAVAKDPSLQPLIDKVKAARPAKGGEGEGKGPRPERKKPEGEPKKEA